MSKIAIYARVSTTNGAQNYTRQLVELRAILKRRGFKKNQIEEFSENVSGYKKEERTEWMALLAKIKQSPKYFSCIYVSELSRIGRKVQDIEDYIRAITSSGVNIYIQSLDLFVLNEKSEISMTSNIVLTVMAELANLEAEIFKTRSKSGLLQSARSGKVGGGASLAYGYKKGPNKMMIINDDESEVIKSIFDLYKNNNGIKAISNILNQ